MHSLTMAWGLALVTEEDFTTTSLPSAKRMRLTFESAPDSKRRTSCIEPHSSWAKEMPGSRRPPY
jgi:hypothetical protein